MVNICEVLKHLIGEFGQINNEDFDLYYVKVVLPAKTTEADRKKIWSTLWGDDESRILPEYTQYPSFEREEDTEPSHIVYGSLKGTNVTEGWQAIESTVKETVKQLILRRYEPESMPDSDTFLDNFSKFANTKVPIQHQAGEVYLWYEFLLKLSQEQGTFINGTFSLSEHCMKELLCVPKIQGLKTDIFKASILALNYLLKKVASEKSEETEQNKELLTSEDTGQENTVIPTGSGQENPELKDIIFIDLKRFNRGTGSFALLTDLIEDKRRDGVTLNATRHGKKQPQSLRDMLIKNGYDNVAKNVKLQNSKITLNIPIEQITTDLQKTAKK